MAGRYDETSPTVDALLPHLQHLAREVAPRRVKEMGEQARTARDSFCSRQAALRTGARCRRQRRGDVLAAGGWPSFR